MIKSTKLLIFTLLLGFSLASESKPKQRHFSINFDNTEIHQAFNLIAIRWGLRLYMSDDITGTVSYSFGNVTLEDALRQITLDKGLVYKITPEKVLLIERGFGSPGVGSNARSPASTSGSGGGSLGIGVPRLIELKYLTTTEAMEKIASVVTKDDRIIEDKPSNTIAFIGGDQSYRNVVETLKLFDIMPRQIYIEAHIVELNKNQSLEFGVSYGDITNPSFNGREGNSAVVANTMPQSPNIGIQVGMGKIDGDVLAARLAAAEVQGNAKILSRPKIVTINNKPADISSGISYSVRTLAAVSASGADSGKGITAGVSTVSAGLNLSVTPTIVGQDRIKLLINVSNSEPDESTNVDGIPGIVRNSTNTEIIVGNGNTASVAGLVKATFAESETGVPFLAKIPILGWFFKSKTKSNRDKELIVFITPRIVDQDFQEQKLEDVKMRTREVLRDPASKSSYPESNVEPPQSR